MNEELIEKAKKFWEESSTLKKIGIGYGALMFFSVFILIALPSGDSRLFYKITKSKNVFGVKLLSN